jgi:nicotinamide-nucleotide amidase
MAAHEDCQTVAETWSKLPPMKAGILAVGTELLGSDRLDTNSLFLTGTLHQFGVEVCRKAVVPDNEEEIASELERYLADLDLVLVTGGLGPTSDDLTREAAARALGVPLIRDPDLLAALEARFRKWGHAMPPSNACQADVIEGAHVLSNPRGTAPGMRVERLGQTLFLFPGVPAELEGLVRSDLEPWLREHTGGRQQETLVLRVACMSESALEDMLGPVYAEFGSHNVSVLASPGDIQVRFRAYGVDNERGEILQAMSASVDKVLRSSVYARGIESSLEGTVGELLLGSGRTVSTAESCTAGLLAERLTRVAGSSEYFVGGVVVYSNRLKQRLLGVSTESLERYGAVSRQVVCEMAEGAVERLESDCAIAISGVAGPGGGTAEKPVGTVHLALAEAGAETAHQELHLPGNRQRIRLLASQWALDMLRRRLLSAGVSQ